MSIVRCSIGGKARDMALGANISTALQVRLTTAPTSPYGRGVKVGLALDEDLAAELAAILRDTANRRLKGDGHVSSSARVALVAADEIERLLTPVDRPPIPGLPSASIYEIRLDYEKETKRFTFQLWRDGQMLQVLSEPTLSTSGLNLQAAIRKAQGWLGTSANFSRTYRKHDNVKAVLTL